MSVVDSNTLEIWVQNGIPDGGELVYNVYIHNISSNDWEVSYKLSNFANLDVEINKRTDALRDVGFPIITKDVIKSLVGPGKYKNKATDLELYRASIEQWVICIVSRIDLFPPDLQDIVEEFFLLPDGPDSSKYLNKRNSLGNGGCDDDIDDNQTEGEDCESTGQSTVGEESQDSSGELPSKKKKRRVVKGFKKRVSKLFLGSNSSNTATTTNYQNSDRDNISHVSDPRDSKSTYESSSGRPSEQSEVSSVCVDDGLRIHQVQTTTLIVSRVQRGGERSRGIYIYEIQLIYHPEKKPFQISHLFSDFVSLNQQLVNSSNVKITSTFPPTLKKESIGIVLTEGEHAERTRLLDFWIKDVLYSYQAMNQLQQHAVKVFLGLNRELHKTYQIQDKLLKGQVEAPRATAATGIASRGSSMSDNHSQTPPRTPRSVAGSGIGGDNSDFSDMQQSPPTLIIPSGSMSTISSSSPARPPLSRRSSAPIVSTNELNSNNNSNNNNKTVEQRKIAYRVKVGSVGSTVIDSSSIVIPSKITETNESIYGDSDKNSKISFNRTNTFNSIPDTFQSTSTLPDNSKTVKNPLIKPNTNEDNIKIESNLNNSSPNNNDSDNETTTKCSCTIL